MSPPTISVDDPRQAYVGKHVNDLPKPSLILDRNIMQRHCQSIRDAVDHLGVDFRPHIKTHKTKEGTHLQAGADTKEVRLVASTVAEIEHILPLLQEHQRSGHAVNVLYGIPLPPSQVDRLGVVVKQLGPDGVSVLVDHASQMVHLNRLVEQTGILVGVYLKVDTGYHRAGLPPRAINKGGLVDKLQSLTKTGSIIFKGVYSHSSLSYNDSTPSKAMANLEGEINGCLEALEENSSLFTPGTDITISVGASPQVTAVENLVGPEGELSDDAKGLKQTIARVSSAFAGTFRTRLELHAGVYSVLDIQQLSTHSRTGLGDFEHEIAVSVVAEVCSVYSDGEREQPEALLALGTLGLGREPCVAYEGWGVLDREASKGNKHRLVIKRISQEHSIVGWEEASGEGNGGQLEPIPLEVGETVRVFPNHACVTGAMYGWYCVVDSAVDKERVVDIWVRASPR